MDGDGNGSGFCCNGGGVNEKAGGECYCPGEHLNYEGGAFRFCCLDKGDDVFELFTIGEYIYNLFGLVGDNVRCRLRARLRRSLPLLHLSVSGLSCWWLRGLAT